MIISDVPSPIDLRLMSDASEWEAAAMEKRPWRTEFFAKFADELLHMQPPPARVLELGSGPGFLAHTLLTESPNLRMTLLDFSEAMHVLARQHLGPMLNRTEFLTGSLKDSDWFQDLNALPHSLVSLLFHFTCGVDSRAYW
jgi:methylase of polypeptide subunit release factors